MYDVRPITKDFEIVLPSCMYPVKCAEKKSLTLSNTAVSQIGSVSILQIIEQQISLAIRKDTESMKKIEDKQRNVLKQLEDLKNQLAKIKNSLTGMAKIHSVSTNATATKSSSFEPLKHDIVINVHPDSIPYGLLGLKNLWKNVVNFDVKIFCHSSIESLNADAQKFEQEIKRNSNPKGDNKIKVSLIWKNSEHTEMICSPAMYVPIFGEVNILRYLCRVGPTEYRWEEHDSPDEADIVLDICYRLLKSKSPKVRLDLLRILDEKLKNRKLFGGEKISIADVGVCSTLMQISKTDGIDKLKNIKEWQGRAKKLILL